MYLTVDVLLVLRTCNDVYIHSKRIML